MDTLIKHLEANALLMCCQIAHRLKDTNGLSMIASGLMDNLYEDNNYEYLQTKYSIQQLINSRFLNILDGEFHGGETVFGKHKIPLECSGAKDYHHYTGLRNLGLCSSDTFNVLKSLLCLDKSKLESTVEELVDKEEIEVVSRSLLLYSPYSHTILIFNLSLLSSCAYSLKQQRTTILVILYKKV